MISFKEALRIIESQAFSPDTETVGLHDSAGRVLARDIYSDTDMPPFNKSAMDGFACRIEDLGDELEIIETVKAGDVPELTVGTGQCTRIMTGGKVPDGADCVIMVEHTADAGKDRIRFTGNDTAVNIAFRGEDLKKDELALQCGTLIRSQHVAVLASAGCDRPVVFVRPRVAVITTGDEIVEPGTIPQGTSIRNSNGAQLTAQIRSMGAVADYKGIVKDTPETTASAIREALEGSDMVVITGGVSAGDFDFVPGAMRSEGVELFFDKVAVKPGRPTVFGRRGDVFVFGLPGNPVSSFTIFELMVKPLLYRMMGHTYRPPFLRLPIGTGYSRKKADRVAWVPVILNGEGEVIPAEYHGSAHIHALTDAFGLMPADPGVFEFKKGERVYVRPV